MSGNGETVLDLIQAAVDRAKPYIDAGPRSPSAWLPSELIVIGACITATGKGGEEGAAQYVDDILAEARNRYAAGFYADPFMEPVQVRAA